MAGSAKSDTAIFGLARSQTPPWPFGFTPHSSLQTPAVVYAFMLRCLLVFILLAHSINYWTYLPLLYIICHRSDSSLSRNLL